MVDSLIRSPTGWKLLRGSFVRFARVAMEQRQHFEHGTRWIDRKNAARQLAPDGKVLHGPFAEVRYPAMESRGSALFPKLLGCYERELHPWIAQASEVGYRSVVDVGCAEGYYAVGLARLWPQAQVHAFDIDLRARKLCAAMAAANGVADRVSIAERCDAQTLLALNLSEPALILSDCEGYEAELFDEPTITALARHDFIIELHDWYDVTISPKLKARFAATHRIESVFSVDDTQKVHQYDYPELAAWPLQDRRALLAERPAVIEWIYCRSLTRASGSAR